MKISIAVVCVFAAAAALNAQDSSETGIGYGGPSILSRGVEQSGRRTGETARFRFFGQVNSLYDTGLLPAASTPEGSVVSDGLVGVEGQLGAFGYHRWRRSSLIFDYRGTYRNYGDHPQYNGSDNTLGLGYATQVSRRVSLTIQPKAGTFSRSFATFGLYSGLLSADPVSPGTPTNEVFDDRTYFAEASARLVFQQSARLSFSISGDAYGVQRQNKALASMTGYTNTADVAYRLNRSQSLFLAYYNLHYGFGQAFGGTDGNMLLVGHSMRIGRSMELSTSLGGMELETKGLHSVLLDPVVAAWVGQTSSIQVLYQKTYIPTSNISLNRQFRKSSVSVSYNQGVSPGNGVYLTSRSRNVGFFGAYSGIRKWDLSGGFAYSQLMGLGFVEGAYSTWSGGGGVAYRLSNLFSMSGRVDTRRAALTTSGFQRDSVRLSFGVTVSPGEMPISLW